MRFKTSLDKFCLVFTKRKRLQKNKIIVNLKNKYICVEIKYQNMSKIILFAN